MQTGGVRRWPQQKQLWGTSLLAGDGGSHHVNYYVRTFLFIATEENREEYKSRIKSEKHITKKGKTRKRKRGTHGSNK